MWSPDGTRIVFQNHVTGDIWSVKQDGSDLVQLTAAAGTNGRLLARDPPERLPAPQGRDAHPRLTHHRLQPVHRARQNARPAARLRLLREPQKSSQYLTVGTGDSNGKPALNEGYMVMRVLPGAPGGVDDTDVALEFFMDDVFTNALADYTGELRARCRCRSPTRTTRPTRAAPAPPRSRRHRSRS